MSFNGEKIGLSFSAEKKKHFNDNTSDFSRFSTK